MRALGYLALGDLQRTLELIRQVGPAVGFTRPSDPVGRWGPVAIKSGRTLANPCAGRAMCTDRDVLDWEVEAKIWADYASKMRAKVAESFFSPDPARWPPKAQLAEQLYVAAREKIGGDPGFWDSSQVQTYANAVFLAKAALELFLQALESMYGKKVDVDPILSKDPITDPSNVPAPPYFPDWPLPSFGSIGLVLAGVVVLIILMRRR